MYKCEICKLEINYFYDFNRSNYYMCAVCFKDYCTKTNLIFSNATRVTKQSDIDNVKHYKGTEVMQFIELFNLDFCLGNTVKYIARAGVKDENKYIEDLEKAKWYLERKIKFLKGELKGDE